MPARLSFILMMRGFIVILYHILDYKKDINQKLIWSNYYKNATNYLLNKAFLIIMPR